MISEMALNEARSGRYVGPIADAHYGVWGEPGDGPYVQVWLQVGLDQRTGRDGYNERILRAAFRTPGCPSSTATGAMLCRLITGRTMEQAGALTEKELLVVLGGLPEGKGDYATGAVHALKVALEAASGHLLRSTEETEEG